MKNLNPFDKISDLYGTEIPSNVRNAAIFVHGVLDLAIASAETHFGDKVDPSIAIAIYDRIVDRMDEESGDLEFKGDFN